jgi:hypothetical protein
MGETVVNPSETNITGTLDGAPITVEAVSGTDDSVTVRSDLGVFTATNTEYSEDHSETLRAYLEHRPSDGWEVAVVDKQKTDEGWSYTVTITNGRLPPERAEFRLSDQVMTTLAGGESMPTDERVARQIAQTVRSDSGRRSSTAPRTRPRLCGSQPRLRRGLRAARPTRSQTRHRERRPRGLAVRARTPPAADLGRTSCRTSKWAAR